MAEVSTVAALSQDAEALPFDIYQRYRLIHDIVERLCPGERLSILDVGGGEGHLRAFFPAARVVVLEPEEAPGTAIRGDARQIPLRADSIDVVVCSDVLEHIPREDRPAAIRELARVARSVVLVGVPCWSEDVERAERIVSTFRRLLLGEEHPCLQEHRLFGLPRTEELLNILEGIGLPYRILPNGYLTEWLAMKLLKQYLMALPENAALLEEVSRFWNRTRYGTANREPAYRKVIVLLKRGHAEGLNSLATLADDPNVPDPSLKEVGEWIASLAVVERTRRALAARDAQITRLRETIREKDGLLSRLLAEGEAKQRDLEILRAEGEAKQRYLEELEVERDRMRRSSLYRVLKRLRWL